MGKRPMLPITFDEYRHVLDVHLDDYCLDNLSEPNQKRLFDAANKKDDATLNKILTALARKNWDNFWKAAQQEKWEMKQEDEREERARKEIERREAEMKFKAAMPEILRLIQEKKLTVTAEFMKSIKDQQLKRKIVEATCLSQV